MLSNQTFFAPRETKPELKDNSKITAPELAEINVTFHDDAETAFAPPETKPELKDDSKITAPELAEINVTFHDDAETATERSLIDVAPHDEAETIAKKFKDLMLADLPQKVLKNQCLEWKFNDQVIVAYHFYCSLQLKVREESHEIKSKNSLSIILNTALRANAIFMRTETKELIPGSCFDWGFAERLRATETDSLVDDYRLYQKVPDNEPINCTESLNIVKMAEVKKGGEAKSKTQSILENVYQKMKANGELRIYKSLTKSGNLIKIIYTSTLYLAALDSLKAANFPIFGSSFETLTLNNEEFQRAFKQSWWKDKIPEKVWNDFTEKLFWLITQCGTKKSITGSEYILSMVWLGDPELYEQECIPADIAVNFLHFLLFNHEKLRRQFVGVKQSDPQRKELYLHMNPDSLSWDSILENSEPIFMHRNLILVNPNIKAEGRRHILLFSYDPKTLMINLRDKPIRAYYQYRNQHEYYKDFRLLLKKYHNSQKNISNIKHTPRIYRFSDAINLSALSAINHTVPSQHQAKLVCQLQCRLPPCRFYHIPAIQWKCLLCGIRSDSTDTHCIKCDSIRGSQPSSPVSVSTHVASKEVVAPLPTTSGPGPDRSCLSVRG